MENNKHSLSKRKLIIWAVVLLSIVFLLKQCGRQRSQDPSPLTPRAEKRNLNSDPKEITAEELLDWSRPDTPVYSVDSVLDAFPNGLSMSMAPLLVDWGRSKLEGQPDDFFIVHNVNVGGNPARGKVMLGTVRIPAHGIHSVEWNFVITRKRGWDTIGGHGQIRFVFKSDALPVVIDHEGDPLLGEAELDDLIISWEAWRPPGARWNAVAGLDPKVYALTVRCYDGAVRFVNDTMFGHAWGCYPLDLPDVPGAEYQLLRTCLIQGDALARRTAQAMFEDSYDAGTVAAELEAEMEVLRSQLSLQVMPDDPMVYAAGKSDMTYHLLLRSCITQALAAIDMTVEEIHRQNNLGERKRLQYAPESLPQWMYDIVHGKRDINRSIARIAGSVKWLIQNTQVLPANAYRILEEADLLQENVDGLVRYYYRADLNTPYGTIYENIAY